MKMKKVISEKTLRNIIKRSISEAMKYDKERKQYYPDYTGNPHSDAGKYTAKNRDDFDYSRNDYKWSGSKRQKRFNDLQFDKDLAIDPFDMPDKDSEDDAEMYLTNKEPYTLVNKATEEMTPVLYQMVDKLYQQAAQKYPILKQGYYKSDFIYGLQKALDEYED